MSGGLNSTGFALLSYDISWNHGGSVITPTASIGLNPGLPLNPSQARGAHSLTRLHDGSFLILGGTSGQISADALNTGLVYTPNP
jgi:hypothetical protein